LLAPGAANARHAAFFHTSSYRTVALIGFPGNRCGLRISVPFPTVITPMVEKVLACGGR
jgi:hypothetical protein